MSQHGCTVEDLNSSGVTDIKKSKCTPSAARHLAFMSERYTESARRALFFGRCEASPCGSIAIETEHLLPGLLHDRKGPLREENSVGGSVLVGHGLRADEVRNVIVKLLAESEAGMTLTHGGAFDEIENLHQLVAQLVAIIPDTSRARTLGPVSIKASID